MGLLDMLAEEMKCNYLSDLRQIPGPNYLLNRAVNRLQLSLFSEREWLDAAEYLCNEKCMSAVSAKETIVNHY